MVRRCTRPKNHTPPCFYGAAVDSRSPADSSLCFSFVRSALHHVPGSDNLPLNLTPEERQAAMSVPNPPVVLPPEPVLVKVLPDWLVQASQGLASLLGLVGATVMTFTALPAWIPFALFAIAALAGFIGGVGLPSWMPSRPLVSAALAGKLMLIAGAIAAFIPHLPEQPAAIRAVAGLVVVILSALAGKTAPQMVAAAAPK